MTVFKRLAFAPYSLVLVLSLTACGGGGDDPTTPYSNGADAAAPAWQSQKVSDPTIACSNPRVVKIQLFGDSTMWGLDGETNTRSGNRPDLALQREMDARYGSGRVVVESRAVGGTYTTQLLDGTDGLNKPWPQSVDADITVLNFGINDRAYVVPDQYAENLRRLNVKVYETPNPISVPADSDNNYAQWMRQVAAEKSAVLADTNAYVRSLPNWTAYFGDKVHPNTALYGMIVHDVLLPAVVPLVESAACDGTKST
ncbi:MAG TPA: SGNH/GDSL hydrolase family protein [Burkholderiaceae bacterium]|nr:SGNH/GDSL hydrolase family protein [Burkholderiaceae bacterium]